MGKAYDVPQTPPAGLHPPIDPAICQPITEFVDGVPVNPTTGRPMVQPGSTDADPSWTQQLQMPGQPGVAPELVSPVPIAGTVALAQAVDVPRKPMVAPAPGMAVASPNPTTTPGMAQPNEQMVGRGIRETSSPPTTPVLPAIPAAPPVTTGKCITEGCKSKTKDRGMCARCLKDTIEYMKADPNVTWEFLEANGLALPSSSASSGNKFLTGLTAKLNRLHNPCDGKSN